MTDPVEILGHEPDPLHALAYLSTPTVPFSDDAVNDLLLASRTWNAMHAITGKLIVLEDDGEVVRFAQWIEGPRSELDACIRRIVADDRHASIDVRRRGPVEARRFPDWDMAFSHADAVSFEDQSGELTGTPR